jgi:hypothetical protein
MSEVDIQCIFNEWQNAIYSHFICYIKQNFDMPSSLVILTFQFGGTNLIPLETMNLLK